MKAIFGLFYEYDGDYVTFIHSMHDKTNMLETDSNVFTDDIINSVI